MVLKKAVLAKDRRSGTELLFCVEKDTDDILEKVSEVKINTFWNESRCMLLCLLIFDAFFGERNCFLFF